MTINVPPTGPALRMWSPTPYENLALGLYRRKLRYLQALTGESGLDTAKMRGYVKDRDVAGEEPQQPWVRLRQKAPDEWVKRVTQADRDRAGERYKKPYRTAWSDDPIVRSGFWWVQGAEDVNMVVARLAVRDAIAGGMDPTFPKPFGADLPAEDKQATAKQLVWAVQDLRLTRRVGDKDKSLRDLMTDLAAAVKTEGGVTSASVEALSRALEDWLNTLHVPVPEPKEYERLGMSQFDGAFPGVDPRRLLDGFGLELTTALLTARTEHGGGSAKALVDLAAWIASLMDRPLREALPQLADYVSFDGSVARSPLTGRWDVSLSKTDGGVPGGDFKPPPDAGSLASRALTWVDAKSGMVSFRLDGSIPVPDGWVWPTCDKDGMYWWKAVISDHCVLALLKRKDTADFHATDLLRFSMLTHLFRGTPDPRVPQYVRDCVKTALLNFKYWIDEPAADGEDGGEMTFWSENHQIQFHAAEFLVGDLFTDAEFPRSGRNRDGRPITGAEHRRRGLERTRRWLDRRLRFGFSEWCSPGYYNEDFPPLMNLADFSPDQEIATKAAMVLDRLIFDLARFQCRGSFASSAGRAYFEHKCFGWEQSVGETVEVLFGSRGDHIGQENTAVALCTAVRYEVPEALLAIGLDRTHMDRVSPLADRSRTSITLDEGGSAGIGKETPDDVSFWWGLGAYFTDELRDHTRRVAESHPNLRKTSPMRLLWSLDDPFDGIPILGGLNGHIRALLLDTVTLSISAGVGSGTAFLAALAPFPINLALGISISLTAQSLIHIITDLGKMVLDGLKSAWAWITGDDPPEPEIPKSVLQETLESMLEMFNRGNTLSRANLYAWCAGDAMLCSVQDHRAGEVSFQKLPWIASLGCDACVWTNAPLTAAGGGSTTKAGFEVFKHILLLQGSEAVADFAKWGGIADMDSLKKEGLYEWGGSICLPKVVQHEGAAISMYNFSLETGAMSKVPTHAWFPTGFFDEVDPAPANEGWLPECDGGGAWVFGRKGDGYVALYSARRVKWMRDDRFDDDPALAGPGKVKDGPFITTELRAEEGSNTWVCAVGTKAQYGSFTAFTEAVRQSYLHISGIGSLNQMECTFDMPRGVDATVGGYRLELFDRDDVARVDGEAIDLSAFPRFQNKYVSGRTAGRVEWDETSYRIAHPELRLWFEHNIQSATRTLGPRQAPTKPKVSVNAPGGIAVGAAARGIAVELKPVDTSAPARSRRRRFRLESSP